MTRVTRRFILGPHTCIKENRIRNAAANHNQPTNLNKTRLLILGRMYLHYAIAHLTHEFTFLFYQSLTLPEKFFKGKVDILSHLETILEESLLGNQTGG